MEQAAAASEAFDPLGRAGCSSWRGEAIRYNDLDTLGHVAGQAFINVCESGDAVAGRAAGAPRGRRPPPHGARTMAYADIARARESTTRGRETGGQLPRRPSPAARRRRQRAGPPTGRRAGAGPRSVEGYGH